MTHHTLCPLCSSSNISMFLECKDHLVTKEVFSLFKCASCNFIFTQDYPGEESIDRYYESDDYVSHDDTAKGFFNRIYRFARNLMLDKKKTIVESKTNRRNGRLLDIGSGTGHFAALMKNNGWEVTGIEPNNKARTYAVKRFGLSILQPEGISDLPESSFDCITLWHVLEHFHEPFKNAAEIKRLLKPGGTCIVALPNSNSYDAEYYGEYWAAYDVPRHLWHFTPRTFRLFAVKAGFGFNRIKCLPLDVFYISALSEKYKGTRLFFPAGMIKGFWFAILSCFSIKKRSSLIYFLKKNHKPNEKT